MKLDESQTAKAYRDHIADIPAGKWREKVIKSVVAVAICIGLGLLIHEDLKTPETPFMPWYIYVGAFIGVGRWLKPDVFDGLAKFAVGLAKDVLALIRNGKGST